MKGIYCIENISNGRKYIGKATFLETRLQSHLDHMRNKTHHNKHLNEDLGRYPFSSFSFRILEIMSDDSTFDDLSEAEERHSLEQESFFPIGYNEKVSDLSSFNSKHSRIVRCYLFTDDVDFFEHYSQAANGIKATPNGVRKACSSKTNYCSGYLFFYEHDFKELPQDAIERKKKNALGYFRNSKLFSEKEKEGV